RIEKNRFTSVSGDTVRIRDFSNFNQVVGNRFERAGAKAAFSEWYCNSDERCGGAREDCVCTKFKSLGIPECPSWGNEFRNNEIGRLFQSEEISHSLVFGPAEHATCEAPLDPGARPLFTDGNTSIND